MKVDYTSLTGGLDLVSGALTVKPGRLVECSNFEQIFGKQGYRRIDGYERFDGRLQPHQAPYWVQPYHSGWGLEIQVGDMASCLGGTAMVLAVELDSGSWLGGGATGRLILADLTLPFAAQSDILVGGMVMAKTGEQGYKGSVALRQHTQYLKLASSHYRAKILPVPGSGPVLGAGVFKGSVYALRNAPDGLSAALWRSTVLGWVLVKDKLYPGGKLVTEVANFSGTTTTLALFGCDGRNSPWRYDGTAFTLMGAIYGSQGTASDVMTIGLGVKTFIIAQSSRSWAPGDDLIAFSRDNPGRRMRGVVSSYSTDTNTLKLNVVEVLGSGAASNWEIGLADWSDKPTTLQAHKDHLFLGYPLGQLQTSDLGNPMTYTTTASVFGVGDEITGLASLRGAVLGVFCASKIYILAGSSTVDWALAINSPSSGARPGSVQDLSGNALFLDDRGLTCLQSTQKFGGFEPAIFSRDVKPLLDAMTDQVAATRFCKRKMQYRMYFKNGTVLTGAVLTPSAELQPGDVSFTRQTYKHTPLCTAAGAMPDGSEGYFFGTADGFVMREDVGTSFDGQPIEAVIRLHFNQLKSPVNKKRFHKLSLELDSPGTVEMRFRQNFDLDDGQYRFSPTATAAGFGGGGRWEVSDWDQFYWSTPVQMVAEANIAGVGRNMGLIVWHQSDTDLPFTLQGFILQYSVMGMSR